MGDAMMHALPTLIVMMECLMFVLVAMGNYIETIRHYFYFMAGFITDVNDVT